MTKRKRKRREKVDQVEAIKAGKEEGEWMWKAREISRGEGLSRPAEIRRRQQEFHSSRTVRCLGKLLVFYIEKKKKQSEKSPLFFFENLLLSRRLGGICQPCGLEPCDQNCGTPVYIILTPSKPLQTSPGQFITKEQRFNDRFSSFRVRWNRQIICLELHLTTGCQISPNVTRLARFLLWARELATLSLVGAE